MIKPNELQRIGYVERQLLAATDLRDDLRYEQSMRALHVRAQHNTWGVVMAGLLPILSDDRRRVVVLTGLAYDCYGREVLLASGLTLSGPSWPNSATAPSLVFDLVIRCAQSEGGTGSANTPAVCLDGESGSGAPAVAIRWVLANHSGWSPAGRPLSFGEDVRLGEDIPLGRFTLAPAGTLSDPDLRVRRVAQPLLGPHVVSATTRHGALKWTYSETGLQASVDTRLGGFVTVPSYFASLVDAPWTGAPVVGPFLSISEPKTDGFRLNCLFAQQPGGPPLPSNEMLLQSGGSATVCWIGVELVQGCPPSSLGSLLLGVDWLEALSWIGQNPPIVTHTP